MTASIPDMAERYDTLNIREAGPFDGPLLASLHAACFLGSEAFGERDGAWNDAAMSEFARAPATLCLLGVAHVLEPAPVGFLIARAAGDEAELLTIGVLPMSRIKGAGRALMKEASKHLRAAGAHELFLEVADDNLAALALYSHFGAKAVGRRPNYYRNGGNATVLRIDLQTVPSDQN